MPGNVRAEPVAGTLRRRKNRGVTPTLVSAASTLLVKWDEAQREHERVCRERRVLIAQRHQELLEIVGYYQGLQAAYAHLRRLRPLDGVTQSGWRPAK